MRTLARDLAAYPGELLGAWRRGWDEFFFRPADPTALGLIRVAVGLLALWNLAVYGLDLHAFFGSAAWADPEIVRQAWRSQNSYAWSFWLLVPDPLLRPVWVVCMAVLALFTLGLFSKTTSALAWAIVVSTIRRTAVSAFGFDQVLSTLTFYLAIAGASGQSVSLDRFLARWREARAAVARRRQDGRWTVAPGAPAPSVSANLSLRLIQLHLCLIYGMAGLAKLRGGPWWDGTAIWGLFTAAEFSPLNLTWLAAFPAVLNLLTHATIVLEVGYPVLIWVRPLRPLLLGAVVLMHVGIGLSAPGLTVFALAMLAGNLAFVSGSWLRSLATGLRQPWGRVLYDGACPRCRASMAFITAADPDRVVEPVDLTAVNVAAIHPSLTKDACMKSMHLARADGKVVAGYDAVVAIGRGMPLFWPLAMLGSAPGVTALGRRAYNALAASRPRDGSCTDEVCGIHHPPGGDGTGRSKPVATGADPGRSHR